MYLSGILQSLGHLIPSCALRSHGFSIVLLYLFDQTPADLENGDHSCLPNGAS